MAECFFTGETTVVACILLEVPENVKRKKTIIYIDKLAISKLCPFWPSIDEYDFVR